MPKPSRFRFFERIPGYQEWQTGYFGRLWQANLWVHGYWEGVGVNLQLKPAHRFEDLEDEQGPLGYQPDGYLRLRVDTLFGGFALELHWTSRRLADLVYEPGGSPD